MIDPELQFYVTLAAVVLFGVCLGVWVIRGDRKARQRWEEAERKKAGEPPAVTK